MIFAGDVAIAHGDCFSFEQFPASSLEVPWCLNLEGAITNSLEVPVWGVYNASRWAESFSRFQLAPLFVGNNHIHDVDDGIELTRAQADADGLCTFGAGADLPTAISPATVDCGRHRYVLLGFGWRVIGCKPAGAKRPGVNPLEAASVMHQAKVALHNAEDARVVVVMHGNYEFERYPQPGHRKLARELIDLGVHAVIGHHPHVVGPVERYRGKTIAYSLGNWAFSFGRFFEGRLRFPRSSFHQVAVELGDEMDLVHHARFSPPTAVTYQSTESVGAQDFSLKPEFEGFDDVEYLRWFRANRIKKKGLPIYRQANASLGNWLRDRWVGARQVLVDSAAKAGLKSMRKSA